jgi:hypothetical protein
MAVREDIAVAWENRNKRRGIKIYSLLLILLPLLAAQNRPASYKGLSKLLPAPAK